MRITWTEIEVENDGKVRDDLYDVRPTDQKYAIVSFGEKHVLLANRVLKRVNLGPDFTQLLLDSRKGIKSQAKVDLAFNFGHFKEFNYHGPM